MDDAPSHRLARSVALGLATLAAGLGAAELTAAADRRFASPITQVGARVIDAAPPWLKTFAIENFGAADKAVLVGSVAVVLVILAVVLARGSRRRPGAAAAGAGAIGLVGALSAAVGSGGPIAAVPSLVAAVAAAATMRALARRAWSPASPDDPVAATAPGPTGDSAREEPTVHHPTGPRPAPAHDRRTFLRATALAAGLGVGAAALGRQLRHRFDAAVARARVVLPGARRPLPALDTASLETGVEGATPFITPAADFYRVDTALELPQVDLDAWRLRITGDVDRRLTFTYDELLERDLVEADVTLTCVSNEVGGHLAGTARWLGVPLRELLDEAGAHPSADQVIGRSVDGYTCGLPTAALADDRTALVVVGMNGEPLPVERGFPARLIVAGLYGYVSATKWLTELRLTTFADTQQYWVPRGWAADAPIKTFSRIDVPAGLGKLTAGRRPIAGVAWAQTRGISRVEVRVDQGPWTEAELRPVPNDETWVHWVAPWDATPGTHTITCRATDGSGTTQTDRRQAPRPDGATGWHSVVAVVS